MTKQELLEIEPEKWIETFGDESLLIFVEDNNTHEFLTLKMIEECLELAEKLTKSLTKSGENKPKIEDIREEAIDILYSMMRGPKVLGFDGEFTPEDVNKRIQDKLLGSVQSILKRDEVKEEV